MKIKPILIGLAAFVAVSANAECIMRTSSITKVVGKIDAITDTKALYGPSVTEDYTCSISARVQYKGEWFTIFGEYTGPDVGRQDMCDNAVELGVRRFLASKEAKLLHSDQQMICSDEAPIKVKHVSRGDMIKLSEVKQHPGKAPFMYKGLDCRWFVENSAKNNDVYQWTGVVCKTGPDSWTVIDKF